MRGSWKSRARSSTSGFTLIELMVAACLMGVAAVALASIFHNGLRLWERSEADMKVDQEARAVLAQIGRDFRNSIDVPGAGWSAEGGAVSFTTLRDVSSGPLRENPAPRILKVTYLSGLPDSRPQRREDALPLQDQGSSGPFALTTYPGQVVWEYAYRSTEGPLAVRWEKEWTSKDSLPAGVRATLTLYGRSAVPQTYSRTFFSGTRELIPWSS